MIGPISQTMPSYRSGAGRSVPLIILPLVIVLVERSQTTRKNLNPYLGLFLANEGSARRLLKVSRPRTVISTKDRKGQFCNGAFHPEKC